MTDYPNNISAKLEIIKASEITPKEVRWLWYPYIPFGKVTLLQGDPGDGKSKLMLSLAALLSKGAPLPLADEDESGEPMTVIYQTTEDDADDTVVPRFNSAGGDGDRLIFIKEDEKSLTFGDDRIREAVEKYNAKLLILDPMSSYIGDTCSMNNANETRAEFNHLIAVAKDTGCAIVIIAHMNKAKDTSPLYRTNGSIDIAGAARSILAVTRTANKQNPAERYLVQVKSNLAPMGSAILFEVADKGVNFLDELELSAEDAFSASAPRMGRPNVREEAATDFIRSLLAGVVAALLVSTQAVFAADMWERFSMIMKDIYGELVAISTIVAVTVAAIALLVRMISRNQRAVDEATSWFKRIVITWIVLNSLGFIVAYLQPLISGGNYNP